MKRSAASRVVTPVGGLDFSERIESSVDRARTVQRELHETIQEGKTFLRELKQIVEDNKANLEQQLGAEVKRQLESLQGATQKAIDDAVEKIGNQFTDLAALYLDEPGDKDGVPLRKTFEKKALLRNLIGEPVASNAEPLVAGQEIITPEGKIYTVAVDLPNIGTLLYENRKDGRLYPAPKL